MSAKIDCLEGMECDVCHSTAIGVNADNEFVCLECSIVQSDPNFGMESRLKVQRTEILHAGDIGSLIGPIKGTVSEYADAAIDPSPKRDYHAYRAMFTRSHSFIY